MPTDLPMDGVIGALLSVMLVGLLWRYLAGRSSLRRTVLCIVITLCFGAFTYPLSRLGAYCLWEDVDCVPDRIVPDRIGPLDPSPEGFLRRSFSIR